MYKINGVAEIEHPIYKIERNGPEALSDEELLALVLRIPQRNGLDVLPKLRSFLRKNPLDKFKPAKVPARNGSSPFDEFQKKE